ncbi:MAG: hypothetical protein SGPRY_007634 [Prymnesium sp.]
MLGSSPLVTKAFRDEFAPLLDWTTDETIDGVEWWDKAHELMLKHGMPPRFLLQRLVREAYMPPRPGALALLQKLAAMNVPVLIVSAGMWTSSNRLNYGTDYVPASVSPEQPVTSFTKAQAYHNAAGFFRLHHNRRMILVIGDSVSDIDAAQNVPYDETLSVGFLNSRPATAMTKYADTFDAVVMGNGGSLAPLSELVELIEINGRARQIEQANRQRMLDKGKAVSDKFAAFDPSSIK